MCLILLSFKAHPAYPLIIAANRDEAYARPASSAAFWGDHPHIHAGRDLEKSGTWLGVTRSGRVAAVTNYRAGYAPKDAPRSRGELVSRFLCGGEDARTYLERVELQAAQYNGFSLIAGDPDALYFYSNRGNAIEKMTPGVHGLSNHLLDTPWPKVAHGRRVLHRLSSAVESELVSGLFDFLTDRTPAADALLPDTGVGLPRERELSPAFISGERYGTRASTVVLVRNDGDVLFRERSFGAGGAPLGETASRFALQKAVIPLV
ncbi:MAG: NRDE family protein [Burkholderiales bacterium]|nr:NRDE family protein [Burkholderiales bacterium]